MSVNSFEGYYMSWKPEINKSDKALYRSLAAKLESDIKNGILMPGTKLPPQRELAKFLDLNVSTVSKAFKLCELKGLISATAGSGTLVAYDALTRDHLLTDADNIIDMGSISPDNSANELILQQLKCMLNEQGAEKWFSCNRLGESEWQKEAAVMLMKKCGYETSREKILFAAGGQNALVAVLAGIFSHGDKIGVDNHIYPGIKTAADMLGIQLVPIRPSGGSMDADALMYYCKKEDLKGVYLIPDCQDPTTNTMSFTQRKIIASVIKEQKIWLIEDASYSLMNDRPISPVASFIPEQSVYITSLSKSLAPGLQIGYASVPISVKSSISRALSNLNVSISPLMAELSARLIVSGQIDIIIREHKNKTRERNELFNRYFPSNIYRGNENSIFRWLHLKGSIKGTYFEQAALDKGVQVYAAERFAVGNTAAERAVRVAICAPESVEELEAGLKILHDIMK